MCLCGNEYNYSQLCKEIRPYRIFLQLINDQSVSEDGPAVFGHFGLLFGPDRRGDVSLKSHKFTARRADVAYESTWFSKERMTGYGEVLKALSAMASITSYSPGQKDQNNRDETSKQKGEQILVWGFNHHKYTIYVIYNRESNLDQHLISLNEKFAVLNESREIPPTLKGISVVMVNPWVM